MSLSSGKYFILNNSNGKDDFAGRNLIEDMSPLPKRVCCPAQGITPFMQETAWDILSIGGDAYQLKSRGAPVGVKDGLLVAYIITEQASDQQWIITPAGNGKYTIQTMDRQTWVAQPEESNQIAVRPQTGAPTELWTIIPAQD
ncbi:hypothetical protein BT96DRAFT_924982 [Gymnopus androsaceus JB14]|uniref:Ricin B lectin domain-containing protein n=1 Tax=Gymnopus androsaceus JB14 TaxID=1447944 RepID=A0A6A4H106_9AGAR|nr:hypothetical protein BT96DRAFT_924982 [Gymnopus androsaceus JB14]